MSELPKLRGFVIGNDGTIREATPDDLQAIQFRICRTPSDPANAGVPQSPTVCYFCGADLMFNPFEVLPMPVKHVCKDCLEGEVLRQREQHRAKADAE